MRQVTIENPILNSPFEEPSRYFRFDDEGITNEIVAGRRRSEFFVPVPLPRKRAGQLALQGEWTADRLEPNPTVNQVRERVATWRRGGYVGVTRTTRRLLDYWQRPDRERRLFFCQIEALETIVYAAEVADRYDGAWLADRLREGNATQSATLHRVAMKMATGSGKTVVMAMLIAWQTLNRLADPRAGRYADAFLVVTPGITIRDRLRVLLPNDEGNYYHQFDLVPPDLAGDLTRARVMITNYHAFLRREKGDASRLTKRLLAGGDATAFTESPGEMVRRACRDLGNAHDIIVINDEAHHCYRHKPEDDADEPRLTGDDRREADKREAQARVWLSGLEAVQSRLGIRTVYDLSATPFFLRGSGHPEGTLFPWVVSDFSLVDAIEAGIVKVPRVPVADPTATEEQPMYRDLWPLVSKDLPKAGRSKQDLPAEPKLPAELEGALHSLYGNYEAHYKTWEASAESSDRGQTPPVFIVVCNNTSVSRLVYNYVAGYAKAQDDASTVLVPGALALFSNVTADGSGRWLARPNTILIDSEELDSGEAMSDEFKQAAAVEIAEFQDQLRQRFPDRKAESLSDEDLLREVMNTVGKPGHLGEGVRCVVSVSMLTEGWDATTVTHILGVRAFGTQLLCEQVVGRGLRRMSHALTDEGHYTPEYAEVYGVPFSFIPVAGSEPPRGPRHNITHVRALDERAACEITFPRVVGYRFRLPERRLAAHFSTDSRLTLSSADIATWTEMAALAGETAFHTLDDLRARREQEVAFVLAKRVLETYFREEDGGGAQVWLFPQLLGISRRWMAECVDCKDEAFPQLLLLAERAQGAADRIYRAIVDATEGERAVLPILHPYHPEGSTRTVAFDTSRPTYATRAKCHLNYVVADTTSWEQRLAIALERLPEVACYVKNDHLGYTIPYTIDGEEHDYTPDFVVRLDDGHGPGDPLNLVVEVTGAGREDKEVKVATARSLWVPAVNNHGGLGRWAFVEVRDPWRAERALSEVLHGGFRDAGH